MTLSLSVALEHESYCVDEHIWIEVGLSSEEPVSVPDLVEGDGGRFRLTLRGPGGSEQTCTPFGNPDEDSADEDLDPGDEMVAEAELGALLDCTTPGRYSVFAELEIAPQQMVQAESGFRVVVPDESRYCPPRVVGSVGLRGLQVPLAARWEGKTSVLVSIADVGGDGVAGMVGTPSRIGRVDGDVRPVRVEIDSDAPTQRLNWVVGATEAELVSVVRFYGANEVRQPLPEGFGTLVEPVLVRADGGYDAFVRGGAGNTTLAWISQPALVRLDRDQVASELGEWPTPEQQVRIPEAHVREVDLPDDVALVTVAAHGSALAFAAAVQRDGAVRVQCAIGDRSGAPSGFHTASVPTARLAKASSIAAAIDRDAAVVAIVVQLGDELMLAAAAFDMHGVRIRDDLRGLQPIAHLGEGVTTVESRAFVVFDDEGHARVDAIALLSDGCVHTVRGAAPVEAQPVRPLAAWPEAHGVAVVTDRDGSLEIVQV